MPHMKTISEIRREKLAALVTQHGSQTKLAEIIGKSPAQVSQWLMPPESRSQRAIGNNSARDIEEKLGLPHGYLDQDDRGIEHRIDNNVTDGPTAHGPYPLISNVQAGAWTEHATAIDPEDLTWGYSTKPLGRDGYFLRVEGASMSNPGGQWHFPEGACLHVRPGAQPNPGQFVIARRNGSSETTFKRFVMIEGKPYLEAINPAWPQRYYPLQEGDVICGVVVDMSYGNLP